MKRNVFVSYSAKDRPLVDSLLRKLRLMDVDAWSDDQLLAGQNWSNVLRERLQASDVFVLLVTPSTFDSAWVMQELGAAWALDKRIVAVASDRRLLDKLPVDLKGATLISLDEVDRLDEIFGSAA